MAMACQQHSQQAQSLRAQAPQQTRPSTAPSNRIYGLPENSSYHQCDWCKQSGHLKRNCPWVKSIEDLDDATKLKMLQSGAYFQAYASWQRQAVTCFHNARQIGTIYELTTSDDAASFIAPCSNITVSAGSITTLTASLQYTDEVTFVARASPAEARTANLLPDLHKRYARLDAEMAILLTMNDQVKALWSIGEQLRAGNKGAKPQSSERQHWCKYWTTDNNTREQIAKILHPRGGLLTYLCGCIDDIAKTMQHKLPMDKQIAEWVLYIEAFCGQVTATLQSILDGLNKHFEQFLEYRIAAQEAYDLVNAAAAGFKITTKWNDSVVKHVQAYQMWKTPPKFLLHWRVPAVQNGLLVSQLTYDPLNPDTGRFTRSTSASSVNGSAGLTQTETPWPVAETLNVAHAGGTALTTKRKRDEGDEKDGGVAKKVAVDGNHVNNNPQESLKEKLARKKLELQNKQRKKRLATHIDAAEQSHRSSSGSQTEDSHTKSRTSSVSGEGSLPTTASPTAASIASSPDQLASPVVHPLQADLEECSGNTRLLSEDPVTNTRKRKREEARDEVEARKSKVSKCGGDVQLNQVIKKDKMKLSVENPATKMRKRKRADDSDKVETRMPKVSNLNSDQQRNYIVETIPPSVPKLDAYQQCDLIVETAPPLVPKLDADQQHDHIIETATPLVLQQEDIATSIESSALNASLVQSEEAQAAPATNKAKPCRDQHESAASLCIIPGLAGFLSPDSGYESSFSSNKSRASHPPSQSPPMSPSRHLQATPEPPHSTETIELNTTKQQVETDGSRANTTSTTSSTPLAS